MAREPSAHNTPVFDQLHPRIHGAAAGLIAWFAVMAWVLFDRASDVSLSLMFMTVLFTVAIALPLSLVWRKFQMPHEEPPKTPSFHDWTGGDLAVWGARLRASDAAIDALLPLGAVSLGLTAIGIVFLIVRAFAA